ncbi:hypothetical protein L917_14066 [Phytophthora nicotianae]|uniref:Uncharacterized protein n=1 Tax=Phytophthora nicotianae TaxID=4792 RepID=W2KMR2_PHYNI|nr:hypothetical protein L917_14066 [Phytophthora nicotianae]
MRRKRKKDNDYPDEWDVVEESQDLDDISSFETVADAWFPPFEIVAKTQDSDGEEEKTDDVDVVAVTDELAQLTPPSQQSTTSSTYRLRETTKNIHSSVICKLTRICKHPWLVHRDPQRSG